MTDARETGAARKIMFVATDLSSGGGVNKVIRDLAVLFTDRLGASVHVVSARSSRQSIYPFPADVEVAYHPKQSLPAYFALLMKLRRARPNVVIGSWTQDNILVTLAFLLSSSKIVLVEHAPWYFHGLFVRLLRWLVYPRASRIIALNPTELAHYRKRLGSVRLLPNPVSAPSPSSGQSREKIILAIGHLEPHKNFEDAIRAMATSGLEHEGWSLAIIGSGQEEGRLHELVRQVGLKNVSIHAPTTDIATWYARSSLMVVTSRIEVFSLVLAEAMQGGVIPIAYATDGPAFILEDFPDHLVDIGDVGSLADRLKHFAACANSALLRNELSASIKNRFSPDVVAEQWRELLS